MMIPFNKPYLTGNETLYITEAVNSGKISGNGGFTKRCHTFFENKYGFLKCLLTSSCTDALEMSAILIDIKPGDEVIIPSYTFVSSANAFVLRGAKIVFADVMSTHPNIDADTLESLVNHKTKAIVVVHYAGVSCDMDKIMGLADRHGLVVIEDAAQAIDSFYIDKNHERKALGSIGHMAAFSFHETKNIISGEGGMLVINDEIFTQRAEIIWEKGTNRSAFFRGETNKYEWVDIGSSFLPSEITAAFLFAQLEKLEKIQNKRKLHRATYFSHLSSWADKNNIQLPFVPEYATDNGHMFYLVCRDRYQRDKLIDNLNRSGILAVFHYLSLHSSSFYKEKHDGRFLNNSDKYSETLVRLPLFFELSDNQLAYIINELIKSDL